MQRQFSQSHYFGSPLYHRWKNLVSDATSQQLDSAGFNFMSQTWMLFRSNVQGCRPRDRCSYQGCFMTVRLLRFFLFFNEFVIEASKKFTDQRKRHASVPLYSYCFTLHSFCSKHTRDVMALTDRFLTFNFSHDNTKAESRKWVKLKMWSIGNHCISLAVFQSLIDVRYGNRSGSVSSELSSFNRCCCCCWLSNSWKLALENRW